MRSKWDLETKLAFLAGLIGGLLIVAIATCASFYVATKQNERGNLLLTLHKKQKD